MAVLEHETDHAYHHGGCAGAAAAGDRALGAQLAGAPGGARTSRPCDEDPYSSEDQQEFGED